MKITILGYESPYPGPNGTGPGFLLEHKNKYYLIDVGSGVLSQLQGQIPLNQIEAVFLSHLHHDHMSDFLVMQYAMQLQFIMNERTNPLTVYYPTEPTNVANLIPFKHYIAPHPIDPSRMVFHDDLQITFMKTDHAVPCYAMKFKTKDKTFIYGADSGINTTWSPFANKADLLILECTYLEKDRPSKPLGHLATSDVANISQAVKPKQLLLTHFYPKYDLKEIETEIKQYNPYGELIMPEIGKVVYV